MEREKFGLSQKILIVLCIIIICVLVYLSVLVPYFTRGEGDTRFSFVEVPYDETVNSTVIHLEDSDFMNKQGVYVQWASGKLSSIRFRNSDNPAILPSDFNDMYGSRPGNRSSRKYLEYNGLYYYGVMAVS